MIGLHCQWQEGELAQPQASRFVASLSIGKGRRMGHRYVGGAFLVSAIGKDRGAHGWMPARTPRGDAVLFHGHIDNRQELLRTLSYHPSACDGDAALYAACLASFGDTCDLKLTGQYAAIVWSPRDRLVRLARSPIQAPALHFWRDKERFIVASASRALFATGEVPCEIDEQKIADSLFLNYREEERGWYKGVQRVPLGAQVHVDARQRSIARYYDLSSLPTIRLRRDRDYVDAANALFEEATRAALTGFAKPAISLSGGLDSQAVAAYAARAIGANAPLLALTGIPEAGWDKLERRGRLGDERRHATALAEHYPNIEVATVDAAGLPFDHKLLAMFLAMGAPPRNVMNLHWIHELRALARQRGCDVVLTGSLGNATLSFDGAGTLPSLLLRGRLLRLARQLGSARLRPAAYLSAFVARAVIPLFPNSLWRAQRQWRHGDDMELPPWCGLNPEWACKMRVRERAEDLGFDPAFRLHANTRAARLAHFAASGESGDLSQAMEAVSGIPKRDPTSYRPFVEFCFGIPDDQFVRDGETRWLARRLLKGKVPDTVLSETRRGLQAADWHLRLDRERHRLDAELASLSADPRMAARFDLPRLRQALASWPQTTPVADNKRSQELCLALPRMLATARFIRYVEGQNA